MAFCLYISSKIILIILLFNHQTYSIDATKGKLLWSDEFDTLSMSASNWKFDIGGFGWYNNELQYYTNLSNTQFDNGSLIIEARKEQYGGNNYTSARIKSTRAFKYGIFEMRARLPPGRGTWPAFWLLATKPVWPDDGEIDVMEHVGLYPGYVVATIHCKKYNHALGTQKTNTTFVSNIFSDYHIYGLAWSSNKIEISVDGNIYFTYNKENSSNNSYDTWPYDNDFNIILNLAIGGAWAGAMGINDSAFPTRYYIDYVRQYEILNETVSQVANQTASNTNKNNLNYILIGLFTLTIILSFA